MNKNLMMRAASALFVLVLLTTCVISGTFAKYTTGASGSDSARVAYWGFDKDAAITLNLFDGEYNGIDGNVTVKSNNEDNVIAPGTSKTTTFAFGSIYTENTAKGIKAPEVDYNFKVTPTVTGNYAVLDNNPNFKWTLKAPDETSATEYSRVADLFTAIKALDGINGTKKYKAGTLPKLFTDPTEVYTIGWEWEFETADNTATTDKNEMVDQDKTDTDMGNAANLGNITFTITVTATQID